MGRHISSSAASNVTATRVAPPGYMGEFGTGLYRVFLSGGTFTVPAGITKIRVRVVGAGGGGKGDSAPFYSGAGGGYAHGVFDVTPGQSYSVTVGNGGYGGFSGTDGQSSSFGALISATGGKGGGSAGGGAVSGGVGVGGDFQASGGNGNNQSGGGAAGSQLGNGGTSTHQGGAAVGGIGAPFWHGASPFGSSSAAGGPDVTGIEEVGVGANGAVNRINAVIRFPFDGFTGGGGTYNSSGAGGKGGPGAGGGGGNPSGGGGFGGGGGAGGGTGNNGKGGIGGGGGVGSGPGQYGGDGGNGIVIVEW